MTENRPPDPEIWVDEYGDYLFRYALFRLRDPAIAEEIVQETFLAALAARDKFAGQSSVKTWFVGILKHKIIDHIRKASRERRVGQDEPPANSVEKPFDERGSWREGPAEWSVNPRTIFERKEFREIFTRCLSNLPPRLCEAFVLRETENLDSEEICKILGVSATNLCVMLHRARMRLRECLEVNGFGRKTGKDK